MDQQTFEAGLKRDGYDVITNTTPGAKVNPEHSHPFDVRAHGAEGRDHPELATATAKTYKPGRDLQHAARLPALRRATGRKARSCCSAARF